MAEASTILSSPQIGAKVAPTLSYVIAAAARQTAKLAVKRQLQARGEKVSQLPARWIALQAEQYLAEHRAELMEESRALVLASPALRELYEREQRKRQRLAERNLRQKHSASAVDPTANSLNETHVQIGGPK